MKPRSYIVVRLSVDHSQLRTLELHSKGSGQRPRSVDWKLSLEEPELNDREVRDLGRDRSVIAMAPVMDLALHQPISKTADHEDRRNAWGIGAVGADTSPYDGRGIRIAVLDTGIDSEHAAFNQVDLTEADFTGEGCKDLNGHGTHCAATIFGSSDSGPRIGVAPRIDRALIGKVLDKNGRGTSASLLKGVNWALTEGAQVISISLGMDFSGLVEMWHRSGMPIRVATSKALEEYRANLTVFEALWAYVRSREELFQPTIVVAAAGNDSDRPNFSIASAPPATGEHVLSVGAVGVGPEGLEVANFSNDRVRVCAPGVAILSAEIGGTLCTMSGTSMAVPHVAGVAALWADRQLRTTGRLDALRLRDEVVGNASIASIRPVADPSAVGAGVVRAPQS